MKKFIVLLMIAPLAGCLENDPQLMDSNDIQSFNFALDFAQIAPVARVSGVTGSASYTGQVGMEVSEANSGMKGNVIGDAQFDVNFDDNSVKGSFDEMILGTAKGSTSYVTGALAVDAVMAGSTFGGSLKGTIGIEIEGDAQQVDVDLQTFGQFHGYSPVSAPADLIGSATGSSTGDAIVAFDSILYYGSTD